MQKYKSVIFSLVLVLYIFSITFLIDQREVLDNHFSEPNKDLRNQSVDKIDISIIEDPILSLSHLAAIPPPSPIDQSCSAPTLPERPSCAGVGNAKIIMLLMREF